MQAFYHPHRIVLLESSFRYPDRWLFLPRARLFPDRIELAGWHLGRRHVRTIMLDQLTEIEWDESTSMAALHLADGSTVKLALPELKHWQESLEQRISWSAPGRHATTTYSVPRFDLSLHDLVTFTTSMG